MTHDEMIAVIQADRDGKTVEMRNGDAWREKTPSDPFWFTGNWEYRIKPTPKRVQLTRDDIPPGTVIAVRGLAKSEWAMVLGTDSGAVWFLSTSGTTVQVTYGRLANDYVYWPPGATKWLPCYKEQS